MEIINVKQGSQEWLDIRAKHFTASEAPAMLGLSKYMSRAELLKQKATGIVHEINAAKQAIFDKGHAAEAAARPLVETAIGEELYPCTAMADIDGLPLLASFDGLTMGEDVAWENKLYSDALVQMIESGDLDGTYWPQVEQQLLISGASRCVFTVSDGTKERTRYLDYVSIPERRAQLLSGWKQFAIDLANYVPQEVIPAAVAAPVEGFGALVLHVEGRVTACNIDTFKAGASAFLARLPKPDELQTDQDFADADAAVKACTEAESKIKAAKDAAMAQAASIDEVFRAVDHIAETIRAARLALEKSVKAEKENRRTALLQTAQAELADHIAKCNAALGKPYMPVIFPKFQEVIKGLKSLTSMQDKLSAEVARCKIEANDIADKIETNLELLRSLAKDHASLFPDTKDLVLKDSDAVEAIIKARIAEYNAAEQKRLDEERESIRKEEEAKAAAKLKTEQDAIAAQASQNTIPPAGPASTSANDGIGETPALGQRETPQGATVQPIQPDTGAKMKLGHISERLGFTVTADFLSSLGFQAISEKNAKLYRECDFPAICAALVRHINTVSIQPMRKAA